MRVDDALRMAGGAGRVAHAERVGLLERGPRVERTTLREQRFVFGETVRNGGVHRVRHDHDVLHARDLVADQREHRIHARVREDHAVLRVVDDVGEVLRREPEVQRVKDRARERRGPVDLEMTMAVPCQRRDAIALRDAEIPQRAREARRARGEVRVRVAEERAARHARRQRLLREEPAAPLEEVRERERVAHHQVVQRRGHRASLWPFNFNG